MAVGRTQSAQPGRFRQGRRDRPRWPRPQRRAVGHPMQVLPARQGAGQKGAGHVFRRRGQPGRRQRASDRRGDHAQLHPRRDARNRTQRMLVAWLERFRVRGDGLVGVPARSTQMAAVFSARLPKAGHRRLRRRIQGARPRQTDHGVRHRQDPHLPAPGRGTHAPARPRGAVQGRQPVPRPVPRPVDRLGFPNAPLVDEAGQGTDPRPRRMFRPLRRRRQRHGRNRPGHALPVHDRPPAAGGSRRNVGNAAGRRRPGRRVLHVPVHPNDHRRAETERHARLRPGRVRRSAPHRRRRRRTRIPVRQNPRQEPRERRTPPVHDRHAQNLLPDRQGQGRRQGRCPVLHGRREHIRPRIPPPRLRQGRGTRHPDRLQGPRPGRQRTGQGRAVRRLDEDPRRAARPRAQGP